MSFPQTTNRNYFFGSMMAQQITGVIETGTHTIAQVDIGARRLKDTETHTFFSLESVDC
jgi:hypothetical protein